MRTLLKFLLAMIALATIVGIVYYVWCMMAKGAVGEPTETAE